MPNFATDFTPNIVSASNTNSQLADQGYTYNEPGLTYNEAGVMYGGIYNQDQDIIPQFLFASSPIPLIAGYIDIYTNNAPPPPNNQKVVGPGWFLYVSQ